MDIVAGLIALVGLTAAIRFFTGRGERGAIMPPPPVVREPRRDEVEILIGQGRMIQAVKVYRSLHKVSLREARDAVEKIALSQRR